MRKLGAYLRNIDGKIVLFYIKEKKNNNNPSWTIIQPVIFYNEKKNYIYIYIFLKTLIYVITLKLRNTNDICICRPCTWRFDAYLLTDGDKNGLVKKRNFEKQLDKRQRHLLSPSSNNEACFGFYLHRYNRCIVWNIDGFQRVRTMPVGNNNCRTAV